MGRLSLGNMELFFGLSKGKKPAQNLRYWVGLPHCCFQKEQLFFFKFGKFCQNTLILLLFYIILFLIFFFIKV